MTTSKRKPKRRGRRISNAELERLLNEFYERKKDTPEGEPIRRAQSPIAGFQRYASGRGL